MRVSAIKHYYKVLSLQFCFQTRRRNTITTTKISCSSMALSLLLLVICHVMMTTTTSLNATSPLVPAVIVFGDSIVDPGNNNGLKTIIKANFPPYGVDFPGHKPTGRFCNGKIASDFIASNVGVKDLLPPYVGSNLSPEELLTGVTFASGGTGYDPLTAKIASVLSMSQQLELFKEYKAKLVAIAGEERATKIVAESLYVICSGSDDIANTYSTTPFRKNEYDGPSYANLMVNSASSFLEDLSNLGARRIGIVSIPPIGCVPSQRTLGGGSFRSCASLENQIAKQFNARLPKNLKRLSSEHPHTRFVLMDVYNILYDIIQNPSKYGLEVSNKGCCGTGVLEVSVLCNSLTSAICADVSKYVFWDSYHPTEGTYKILVDYLIKNYINVLLN